MLSVEKAIGKVLVDMNIIGIVFLVAFVVVLVYFVIEGAESALISLIVKDENDYEALRFIIGCVSAKVSGAQMPEKPSYIGAEKIPAGKRWCGGKRL